jgi:non-ribosomal peptide synthetase component F
MLGVLKAGAAYLPLNPSDPTLRLGQVISHAASRFIVTDSQSMTNLPEVSSPVCVLDRQPITATEGDSGSALHAPKLTDLAYVIYTSGTTGIPKRVLQSRTVRSQMFLPTSRNALLSLTVPAGLRLPPFLLTLQPLSSYCLFVAGAR